MNVLSLFDGMSCGQIALNRLGIKYDKYFASEIDKYAIKVTQNNYPNTIQLGDVKNVHAKDLPKIDLLIGGSPCQGFSFAGKGLNFEDERSKLFFEFVRLKNELQPTYFLLENVRMKSEYEVVISKYMGIEPLEINSALVSAQNRIRLYWTNINAKPYNLFGDLMPDIPQPKDKGILLKDILEKKITEKYYLTEKGVAGLLRAMEREHKPTFICEEDKSSAIDTRVGANTHRGQYVMYQLPHGTNPGGQVAKNGKVPSITKSAWEHNNLLVGDYRVDEGYRWRKNGKSPTLQARAREDESCSALLKQGQRIRRLTPIECERLQTVPDNYTNCISDSQRYKMLGNGWTVDVIVHLFNQMALQKPNANFFKSDCKEKSVL